MAALLGLGLGLGLGFGAGALHQLHTRKASNRVMSWLGFVLSILGTVLAIIGIVIVMNAAHKLQVDLNNIPANQ